MRLERHVGGMGKGRQRRYLEARGWSESPAGWLHTDRATELQRLSRALHHQLTHDLSHALAKWGWRVTSFSERGYARLRDAQTLKEHSLPAALRVEARRQNLKVGDFTYALFLAATLGELQ